MTVCQVLAQLMTVEINLVKQINFFSPLRQTANPLLKKDELMKEMLKRNLVTEKPRRK